MTPENFCYWLHGLFELQPDLKQLTPEQTECVKRHLALVFTKVTTPLPVPRSPLLDPVHWPDWFKPGEVICAPDTIKVTCNCTGGFKAWDCTNL